MLNNFPIKKLSAKSISNLKLVFGVGVNDADYQVSPIVAGKRYYCPYYRTWKGMLQRCYKPELNKNNRTYLGCSVCKEWLVFSNFKDWMQEQDWQGKQLDKDILIKGNKEYSAEKCRFVSAEINCLLNNNLTKRGKFLLGVSWCKKVNKFVASYKIKGKTTFIGRYISEQEAHNMYCKKKREHILFLAALQKDFELKKALIFRANTDYV